MAADGTASDAIRFRGGGFEPRPSRFASWAALISIIAVWQGVISIGWLDPLFLPSPVSIALALQRLVVSGDLWVHLAASLSRIGIGWVTGVVAGLVVGVAMGLYSLARSVGLPMVSALFPIPKIALLPLLILWLGIGETSKVVTIALGVFFPTVISTYTGVDAVPRNLIRMAQSFNIPFRQIVWKIVLPGALLSILAGMRISASLALMLVVSATSQVGRFS
jgi:NitT/TauT family transport system permease protein